jgi:hypothetical protein
MASHTSAKLSDVDLAESFSRVRDGMKWKLQEVVQQSVANLAELVTFLVLSHQHLNDPKFECELTADILARFENWHDELLNSCFNFKRINYRHLSDFKFNLGTSKGSDKLFAKLDRLTDLMRHPAAIAEIVEDSTRLQRFFLSVLRILDSRPDTCTPPPPTAAAPFQPLLPRLEVQASHQLAAPAKPQPACRPVPLQSPVSLAAATDSQHEKLQARKRYQTQSEYLGQDKSSTLYELQDDSRNYLTEKVVVNDSKFTSEYARSRKSVNGPKKYGRAPLAREQPPRDASGSPLQKRKSTTKVVVSTRLIEEMHEENKENLAHHQSIGRIDKTPVVSKESSKPNSTSNSYIGIESVSEFLGNYRAAEPDPQRMLRLSELSADADSCLLNFSDQKPKPQPDAKLFEEDSRSLPSRVEAKTVKCDQIAAMRFRDDLESVGVSELAASQLGAEAGFDLFLDPQEPKLAPHSIGAGVPLQQFNTNQQSDCMTFHGTNNPDNFVSNNSEQNKILKNFLTFSNNAAVDYQSKTDLDSASLQPKKKGSQKELTGKAYKSESEQNLCLAKKRGSEVLQTCPEQQQLAGTNLLHAERKPTTYSTNQDRFSAQNSLQEFDRRSDHFQNIFKNTDAR